MSVVSLVLVFLSASSFLFGVFWCCSFSFCLNSLMLFLHALLVPVSIPWDTLKLKLLTPMSYRRLMDRPSRDSFRASLDLVRVHRYRTVQSFQEPIHNQCLHIFVHNRADAPIHTRNLNLSVLQTQI